MGIFFRGREILEMAERIEQNGARFYRQASGCIADAGTRNLLQQLAGMEDEHLRTFSAIKGSLPPQEFDRTPPPGGLEEEQRYLCAWADGHVFDTKADPCARLSGKASEEEVLHIAMGMEKDSIVFYLGFKDAVPSEADRGNLDRIIKEELKHLAELGTRMKALKKEMQ